MIRPKTVDEEVPEIVCLCGSTKFKYEYRSANKELTLAGKIVVSVGFFGHADGWPDDPDGGIKADLDELHKRKIDLADRIHVINVGGYIGTSTESEIKYAVETGTPVTWWNEEKVPGRLREAVN